MASVTGSAISAPLSLSRPSPINLKAKATATASNGASSFNSNSVSFSFFTQKRTKFPSLSFSFSCAAQKETVDKVCEIVRKQLALPDDTAVSGESEFSKLGADSLDTVEIVMGLEEHFEISVDEGSAQDIKTVHDAAQMIEELKAKTG
ncbi:hypothetical protein LUZ63_008746 [Rhynchospora breviuscula]|uniref:Acyl carrier protein n=1 Tax=Rhynchospora breviuscula TaxID=2022672 RepID=A0A9Q0CDR7_9POAL|nr:hypothetical protein LUZ63_008746 [Rhynchospora breviuscula]